MTKIIVFAISIFLLFYQLGRPLLWQDEAEVAMIARNITRYGLPVTYNGDYLITQTEGQDSRLIGGKYIWSWNTWLSYYATATSFKVFGESTAAARLPFALAGVGTLIIYYLLAKKIFGDQKSGTIICLLVLATNTIFYLYSRQARYYAFSMFFPLCAVYFYFSKRYFFYFLSLLASFHSNFVLAFGFNLPLIVISLKKRYTLLFLAQSFLWLWYFHPAAAGDQLGFIRYWQGISGVFTKIGGYVNLINSFYFPLILAVPILIFRKINPILAVLAVGCIVHVAVIGIFLQFGQRNLVTLIPVFSLFIGFFLTQVWRKNIFLFCLLLSIVLFTNLFFIVSEKVIHPSFLLSKPNIRTFFLDYLTSFPKAYPGPLEGISKFLVAQNIKDKSALIYSDYETNSLRFYFPNLRFVDHPSTDVIYWLPRHNWGYLNELTSCQKQLLEGQAQKFVLSNFDTQWENMPDITYHQFTISNDTPHVTIYKVTNNINWKQCD